MTWPLWKPIVHYLTGHFGLAERYIESSWWKECLGLVLWVLVNFAGITHEFHGIICRFTAEFVWCNASVSFSCEEMDDFGLDIEYSTRALLLMHTRTSYVSNSKISTYLRSSVPHFHLTWLTTSSNSSCLVDIWTHHIVLQSDYGGEVRICERREFAHNLIIWIQEVM